MSPCPITHISNKPLVEVFTLDSDTCAACGYMLGAAQPRGRELGGQVDMVEYKFTDAENVARVVKMGVKNLPSLYINGELKYSSIIPSNRELMEEIEKDQSNETCTWWVDFSAAERHSHHSRRKAPDGPRAAGGRGHQ